MVSMLASQYLSNGDFLDFWLNAGDFDRDLDFLERLVANDSPHFLPEFRIEFFPELLVVERNGELDLRGFYTAGLYLCLFFWGT